ncbi:light-harvesting protein [Tropicimonas sp. S265A]|uniref:light-harvesting protein n=1 Tax=Tropicimonas sp. S265A TaxID=3415134 RepID=UPI003C7BF90F
MNNAKMWLVVPPALGVPLFLGAVAVGSFSVHVAVLSNTSWVSDFLSGQELGTGDEMAAAAAASELETAKASFVIDGEHGSQELLVILPDGTVAKAIVQGQEVLASAAPPPNL